MSGICTWRQPVFDPYAHAKSLFARILARMTHPWPGPLTEPVRNALADHGAELLPSHVEEWLRWIPDNVLSDIGSPGRESPADDPYADFDVADWCHLILFAHELVPNGPSALTVDHALRVNVLSMLEDWIVSGDLLLGGQGSDEDFLFDELNERVVLPLAVFTKGLAMLSAVPASTKTLISAHVAVNGEVPQSSPHSAIDFAGRPELLELLELVAAVSSLASAIPLVVLPLRDTAGDVEVLDDLVVKMAESLTAFADLDLVAELEDTPLEPAFLGTVGDLAGQCYRVSADLFEAMEFAEIA